MTNQPEKKPNTDTAVPEASSLPAAANGNDPAAPAPETQATTAKKYGWGKKALSISFNIAAGFAASAAAKSLVAIPMTFFSAPAVATLLVSSLAVGAAMTTMCHAGQTYKARKNGLEGPKFWTKQNRNIFLKSSGFALIGGYTTAILLSRYGLSFWIALPASALMASPSCVVISPRLSQRIAA